MPCYATNDTSGTWGYWVAAASTSSCTASDATWEVWVDTGTTCSTADTATNVWVKWTTCAGVTSSPAYTVARHATPPVITPEERARLDAEVKRRAEEYAVAEAARKEADKRAEELLVAHLDGEQKKQYRRDRSFTMRARDGRRYRVRRAWSGHVSRLDDAGKEVERLCCHPKVAVPLPDNQLFAKLMLETDPEQFLRTANRHPVPAGAN